MQYKGTKIGAMLGIIGILSMMNPVCTQATEIQAKDTTNNMTTTEMTYIETVKEDEDFSSMVKKSSSTTKVKNFGYWVYRPTDSKEEKLPLIVYMHGITERGNNLDKLITVSLPKYLYDGSQSVNAVVIAPQCPKSTNWTNLADDVMELIQTVIEEENIDETSISLTGHSLGGIGTWTIAMKYPDVFASLVPVSSTIKTPNATTSLVDIPVWSFHGAKDTMTPTSMLKAEKVINGAGGNMQVTMFPKEGHCITGLVYNNSEYDVLNWMASQHRITKEEEQMQFVEISSEEVAAAEKMQ